MDWVLPTHPALTTAEVAAVEKWVSDGGSLLLIADHMPFAGAAAKLAAAFGIIFQNGYAIRPADYAGQYVFRRGDKSLGDDIITRGARRKNISIPS